jgi:hypothetical protein
VVADEGGAARGFPRGAIVEPRHKVLIAIPAKMSRGNRKPTAHQIKFLAGIVKRSALAPGENITT